MSIIVGRNNAGKSTILEALKIVSIVAIRAAKLNYLPVPDWLDIPVGNRGVTPSLNGIDFDFRNVCTNYSDPPAVINAEFSNGAKINVYLNSDEEAIFAVIQEMDRRPVTSRAEARQLKLGQIFTLPPIGPLLLNENELVPEYVRASTETNLAPRHFRNQLWLSDEETYESFVKIAEETWPHLAIDGIEIGQGDADREVHLFVRDGAFVAEVGWVGHGLQAWLQIIWFLCRVPNNCTVILDEPDLFMHADLQRQLIRLLSGKYTQVIVATHSIEIIADVDPRAILIVDKSQRRSQFATSIPAVQQVIGEIGGVHNLQLARLWVARKCLFVEGNDLRYLNILHRKLFPDTAEALASVPSISIGGAGNWKHAVGASIGLKNAGDKAIKTYCLLDSDYRVPEQSEELTKEAKQHNLQVHIWKRKEIENYLIITSAIHRFIHENKIKEGNAPTMDTIRRAIERFCDQLKDDVTDAIAVEANLANRKAGIKGANVRARKIIQESWKSFEGKCAVVSGKELFSRLSKWSKNNYGVSFSAISIAHTVIREELAQEIIDVLSAVENLKNFK